MSHDESVLPRLFLEHQRVLRSALDLPRSAIDHSTSKGDVSEAQWRNMLSKYLPQRYRVCKGHVVDSKGGTSQQIDVIIHDAHYCPRFLDEEALCFVPAESVYAVFEVKQELSARYVTEAGGRVASVRSLFRTSAPIIDCGVVKPARPLTPILGGVLALASSWTDGLGESFKEALANLQLDEKLDMGCVIAAGAFELSEADSGPELLIAPADAALVTFFLRLVHRLQAIGTIPAIQWPAYIQCALPPAVATAGSAAE